jgi:fumarate hydratase class II
LRAARGGCILPRPNRDLQTARPLDIAMTDTSTSGFRTERDSLGEMQVPADALYGPQTQRAVENFPISGIRFPRRFIHALGTIKKAAAQANVEMGLLEAEIGDAIARAADEVIEGRLDGEFVLDVFQTGSGTSSNMNANEVIATRATQLLGGGRKVHPNDHVNMGQSSNDVIPTAMHVSGRVAILEDLAPALERLRDALQAKAAEFDDVVKSGRTHLMDATPVRLGQEFGGYASQLEHGLRRLRNASEELAELALGGTAVGTGTNAVPGFPALTIRKISESTGLEFTEAENHFEAQGAKDAYVSASGALNTLAVSLLKIANDIRWLASGPTSGLAEITLPAIQPGSSIMPGKVNPVMSEAMMMLCAQVMGNHVAVTVGGQHGNFELNVMMPVMAHNFLQSVAILSSGCDAFRANAVEGIGANRERCRELLEKNPSIATALNAYIGYDEAAAVAKESAKNYESVRTVVKRRGLLSDEQLDTVLNVREMTEPGIPGGGVVGGGGG